MVNCSAQFLTSQNNCNNAATWNSITRSGAESWHHLGCLEFYNPAGCKLGNVLGYCFPVIIFMTWPFFFYSGVVRCGDLSGCGLRMAGSRSTAGRREWRCTRDRSAARPAGNETGSPGEHITIKHTRGKTDSFTVKIWINLHCVFSFSFS